jgi:hypothetical protein
MKILVNPDGSVCCVYGEAIDLSALGAVSIRRASHIEPDEEGRWIADLGPVGEPLLGPFALRSEALEAEAAWLDNYLFPTTPGE